MSEKAKTRRSGIGLLRSIPAVFGLPDAMRAIGGSRNAAKVYCSRWKRAGLIAPLGPRNVGVFFNLIVDPQGPVERRAEAVRKLLRRPAVVVGPKALHAHGWTTQRHHVLHLAVPTTRQVRSLPKLNHGITLLPRSLRWFQTLAQSAEPGIESFQVARPEMALADALLSSGPKMGVSIGRTMDWRPALDEVEVGGRGTRKWRAVQKALLALGASPNEARQMLIDLSS